MDMGINVFYGLTLLILCILNPIRDSVAQPEPVIGLMDFEGKETGAVTSLKHNDLLLESDVETEILRVNIQSLQVPVLINKPDNRIYRIEIVTTGENLPLKMEEIEVEIGNTDQDIVKKIEVYYTGTNSDFNTKVKFGESEVKGSLKKIKGEQVLHQGSNTFWICATVSEDADLRSILHSLVSTVKISGKDYHFKNKVAEGMHRLGLSIRDHNQDGAHTHRIPGLVTTKKGTLIAVYDVRWNSATDLQGDIDVGMSRSVDGGQTWEPMKIIMDMQAWGGLPEEENGIGDPSILVDRNTNTIWVAAVWAHGHKDKRNWTESKPGMNPDRTSQFMLVKSEDDGITWQPPVNITRQIKDEAWPLLLQGPGKGITLSDGTLVFPAQYKDIDHIPYATIIWSKDQGVHWNIGTGAKSNTTEAQVIELKDGSLMLNMRDNRNRQDKSETNGRSVTTSKDLGKTWREHPTSRSTLIEPVCMASLIKADFVLNGDRKSLVLFSNPASKYERENITLKISFDDGNSWPVDYHLLLDEGKGRGYSCMTKIDNQHIGIIYESSIVDLVFQVVDIEGYINSTRE